MKEVYLIRLTTSDQGTLGQIFIQNNFYSHCIELPWRDNKPNISCIPEGSYICNLVFSRKFGWVFHVTNVPGRTAILMHSGNVAGDRSLGFKSHSYGCILLGRKTGFLWGQKAVLISRPTVNDFKHRFEEKQFRLTILNTTSTEMRI